MTDYQSIFEKSIQVAVKRNREPSMHEFWRIYDEGEDLDEYGGKISIGYAAFGEFLSRVGIEHPHGYAGWFDYFARTSNFNLPRIDPKKPAPPVTDFINAYIWQLVRDFEHWENVKLDHWKDVQIYALDSMSMYRFDEKMDYVERMKTDAFKEELRDDAYSPLLKKYKIRKDTPRHVELLKISDPVFTQMYVNNYNKILDDAKKELEHEIEGVEKSVKEDVDPIVSKFLTLKKVIPAFANIASDADVERLSSILCRIDKYEKSILKKRLEAKERVSKARTSIKEAKEFIDDVVVDRRAVEESKVKMVDWQKEQSALAKKRQEKREGTKK